MAYLLLGLALLAGLLLIIKGFVEADPQALKAALKWLAIVSLLLVTVFLAATGRLAWAVGTAMMLFPLASRLYRAQRTMKNFSRAAGMGGGGQATTVETRHLRMSLDHDSGAMDGEILQGPYAGQRLSELAVDDIAQLVDVCNRQDPESARILEAYLDRAHPDWRQHTGQSGETDNSGSRPDDRAAMTVDEAYAVLGLQSGADEAEIKAAHQRLIAALHPDMGGSNYLAAQINRARQVLLGR